jgi:uncharacterized protein YndB with AHSA1/START domain
MSTVHATIEAPIDDVWEALVDVRTYPDWLIGARKIRAIDDDWPAPGTAFHHTVGLGGPLTISDRTRSLAVEPKRRLVLDVRAWPLVHGEVTFELRTAGDGTTEVALEEHPVGIHRLFTPLLAPMAAARNKASLEKLEHRVRERIGRE